MPPKKVAKSDNTALGSSQSLSQMSSLDPLTGDNDDEPGQMTLSRDMQTLVSAITASFTAIFNTSIEKIVHAIDRRLSQKLDSHDVEIFDLNKRCDKLEKQNNDLSKENSELRDMIKSLVNKTDVIDRTMDDLEQYSRNMNILVHGMPTVIQQPENKETDLEARVITLFNSTLGTALKESDISVMHRLPGPSGSNSASTRPSPVLVQFTNGKTRNLVLSKRRLLKGKSVSLTEQLTAKKTALLKKANGLAQNN